MENQNFTTEIIHKEIDLIQACITRMANNSFLLKGWYISLVTIVLTLLLSQGSRIELVGLLLLVITITFWVLDAFFLKTETLYRWKYEWVIEERLKGNNNYLYNLNPKKKDMWVNSNEKNDCLVRFAFSKTLIPLYIFPMVVSLSIIVYYIIF